MVVLHYWLIEIAYWLEHFMYVYSKAIIPVMTLTFRANRIEENSFSVPLSQDILKVEGNVNIS